MTPFIVIFSAVFFLAMILNLAAKPRFTRGLIGIFTFLAAVGGLILYGIGFSYTLSNPLQMVIRTVFAVCRMYAGVNDLSSVGSAPIFAYPWVVSVFWVLHLMAFYAMASATISVIGESALKKLRYWLQRYGDSVIVYGINEEAVQLGRELISSGSRHLIFVGSKPDASLEKAVNAAGALVRSDLSALTPNISFLKSLGSHKGSPSLTLYALDENGQQNVRYAEKLLDALREAEVGNENLRLILRGREEGVESPLAATKEHYGFSDVKYFTEPAVAARLLMQAAPPCDTMHFDQDGLAEEDFDAVIVGFGRTGRNVLRQLLQHAQFEGSHFHAAVFSPKTAQENGFFCCSYPALTQNYDIEFRQDDAMSLAFYRYLSEHAASLKYLVICTGNEAKDADLWSEIESFLQQSGSAAVVSRCHSRSISWCEMPGGPEYTRPVFSRDVISGERADRMARIVNYSYVQDPALTPETAWQSCDHFSRESSRASADFMPAFLKMAGRSAGEVRQNGWAGLSERCLENMARTEHLRWCAFHFAMGFTKMDEETLRSRGEAYRKELAETGKASLRITKDLTNRRHACLCSFDELAELSRTEQEYTGKFTDYQQMDRNNVMALPDILKAADGEK